MSRTRSVLFLLLGLALTTPAFPAATPPERISYQGVLRSATGAPLDGTYDMVFRFTDAPAGGTLLLTDYHTGPDAIVVDGGLFTALLGTGTLAPGAASTLLEVFAQTSPVYLEVQVGAETLAPRVEIVSTPYSLNAGRFGGQLPGSFLDTGPAPQTKSGLLSSDTGLVAESTAPGGDVRAVQGSTLSTAGVGVLGSALAGSGVTEGVRGQSTSPDGRGVVGGAFATSGATVGVYGESQSGDGTGVYGKATATAGGTTGVGGESFSTLGSGVAGIAHATTGDAWGVYGETASPTGYGVVSIGDSITSGDVYATGTKFFLTEHPFAPDQAIRFACLEGGEVGVYHRGRGRLVDGEARIRLPEPFPLVAAGQLTVQVTPESDSGALYVPRGELTPDGFTVRESGGGKSNSDFTYLVLAERQGYAGVAPIRALSVSDKILASPRLTPSQKAMLRAALPAESIERADADQRARLYSALHDGDLDASCRVLGGCSPRPTVDRPALERPHAIEPGSGLLETGSEPTSRPDRSGEGMPAPGAPALPVTPRLIPSVLAALHLVSEPVAAGDVVVLDRLADDLLRPGDEAADPNVVGVVAFVREPVTPGRQAPVAVGGTVPCRVDASYGPIAAGDLLVSSPTRGHAMRGIEPAPGTILGKALEPLAGGRGTIRVLLTPR